LQIKAFAEMPIKKANAKFFINQSLRSAIGFIAGSPYKNNIFAVQQKICA
jgi:hypothetical protein